MTTHDVTPLETGASQPAWLLALLLVFAVGLLGASFAVELLLGAVRWMRRR
jgi:hypothetical protein